MRCQVPRSRPAAATRISTSSGAMLGRSIVASASWSAVPYAFCTMARMVPALEVEVVVSLVLVVMSMVVRLREGAAVVPRRVLALRCK